MAGLRFDEDGALRSRSGLRFEPRAWAWTPAPPPAAPGPSVSATEALARLAREGRLRPVPVGVIGPREATEAQRATARALGARLAAMGLPVLCGGRSGVMEAVAEGVSAAGGLAIGLLPEDDWRAGNAFVLPVATGLGRARNVVIAQASRALVAVGGELGTLTEIAFGLHFGKPVWGLEGAPEAPGLRREESVEAVCEALAAFLLDIPDPS